MRAKIVLGGRLGQRRSEKGFQGKIQGRKRMIVVSWGGRGYYKGKKSRDVIEKRSWAGVSSDRTVAEVTGGQGSEVAKH